MVREKFICYRSFGMAVLGDESRIRTKKKGKKRPIELLY